MKIINKLDDITPNLYTEDYVNKLKEEPDIHEFNDAFIIEDFIELLEIYKDFLHED